MDVIFTSCFFKQLHQVFPNLRFAHLGYVFQTINKTHFISANANGSCINFSH